MPTSRDVATATPSPPAHVEAALALCVRERAARGVAHLLPRCSFPSRADRKIPASPPKEIPAMVLLVCDMVLEP